MSIELMEFLTARQNDDGGDALLVFGKRGISITIIGSGLPVTISDRGTRTTDSFHIIGTNHPDNSLIALLLTGNKPSSLPNTSLAILVKVEWNSSDNRHTLVLKESAFCKSDVVLQCVRYTISNAAIEGLELTCVDSSGGESIVFTTNPEDTSKWYVPNPDILCQAAAGQISIEEVKAAAREAEEELSARERVEELQQELDEKQKELLGFSDEVGKKGEEIKEVQGFLQAKSAQLDLAKSHIRMLVSRAEHYLGLQLMQSLRNKLPSKGRRSLRREIADSAEVVKHFV